MLSVVTWSVALAIGLGAGLDPVASTPVLDAPSRHVRAADYGMRTLLGSGFQHSPTFAALLERLEHYDLIVYVEEVPRLSGALEGRLLVQPPAYGFRYARIQIARRGSPQDSIAVLGHELQHALEVAEAPEVVDAAGLVALYRRIGIDHGHNEFDTTAARETGRRVLKELVA